MARTLARGRRTRRPRSAWLGWLFALPAIAVYLVFVIRPLLLTVQYSFYDWNGIGAATWIGLDNYVRLFTDSELFGTIVHAFELILFFSFVPVLLGLAVAATIRRIAESRLAVVARTVLFLPQVIPLVAAGIMWTWLLSTTGLINQLLSAVGLGSLTRAWLGEFDTALPAVGVIGAWVQIGLCTLLLLAGMSKIDNSLYEAARLDGASELRILWSIAMPLVRPALMTATLLTFIGPWNEFLWPFLVTKQQDMQPFAVALANYMNNVAGRATNPDGANMAGGVLLAIPPVVLFLIFQKHFTSANIGSGVKG